MSRIQEILSLFAATAANPAKAVADWEQQTGKGAVGIMPVYSPEEIVHAAGYLPVGLWGGKRVISKARVHLPPFACSIMQSVMELQLDKVYDGLKAVMVSTPCDTLKCMSQKWYGASQPVVFVHPQNRGLESATIFLAEEYRIAKTKLEAILGVSICEESIQNSIAVYNENRQAMRAFSQVATRYPHLVDPVQRHAVFKARWFMEKSQHTALVRELTAELEKQPEQRWKGKKVILTGIMAEPDELLEILRDSGFAVADDDLAQESRQIRHDTPEGGDALMRLARWWQNLEGCSLATDRRKGRGPMLREMVRARKADAVIFCMMKFCEPEEFDYPIFYKQLEDEGIANLLLEIDQESASFEQARTRVQTFSEVLM